MNKKYVFWFLIFAFLISVGAVRVGYFDFTVRLQNSDGTNIDLVSTGVTIVNVEDNPEFFEDTSFVTGDSPATIDLNAALSRNASEGTVINDGWGDFTVSFSTNGSDYGDEIRLEVGDTYDYDNSVDSLKITWITDSAYRITGI